MAPHENQLIPLVKAATSDLLGSEDLILEALRDLVKDEVKKAIHQRLDENPALRKEVRDAIGEYLEAKTRQVYASVKLAKAGAKLGIALLPKEMKEEMSKEILQLVEKELTSIMDRGG